MIGCLTLVFTVDRVEEEVAVLEVGTEHLDVVGLPEVHEGARFVLCELPPPATGLAPAPASSPSSASAAPSTPHPAPT